MVRRSVIQRVALKFLSSFSSLLLFAKGKDTTRVKRQCQGLRSTIGFCSIGTFCTKLFKQSDIHMYPKNSAVFNRLLLSLCLIDSETVIRLTISSNCACILSRRVIYTCYNTVIVTVFYVMVHRYIFIRLIT